MIILSDSDVIRKLAYCELLPEFLQYLRSPPNEVWVLPALRFQLQRKLAATPAALKIFEQFLLRVKTIPEAKIETLERFDSLDVGEGQLLAILCDEPRVSLLVTGDKRALNKIAALTFGDVQLRKRLQETSVYCLESILLGLLSKRGFSIMHARIWNKWATAAALAGDKVDSFILEAFPKSGGSQEIAVSTLKERIATLTVRLPQLVFEAENLDVQTLSVKLGAASLAA